MRTKHNIRALVIMGFIGYLAYSLGGTTALIITAVLFLLINLT